MEYTQESKLDLRCGAPGCQSHHVVMFKTYDEVVQDDGWILPKGWREVETTVKGEQMFYVCCPKHHIELAPTFVDYAQTIEVNEPFEKDEW